MLAKNVTRDQMEKALEKVNEKYKGNIVFKRFDPTGRQFRFTLKVLNCRRPGGRLSVYPIMARRAPEFFNREGREIKDRHVGCAACWHAHGDFFDCLFSLSPEAVIVSRGNKIDRHSGNWNDYNIGSMISPVYASEACECNPEERGLTSDCWLIQFTGLEACKSCEAKGKRNCGGKAIIEKIKNGTYPENGIGKRAS